jgi:asparagine synthase (glutamine-hydrolysing)
MTGFVMAAHSGAGPSMEAAQALREEARRHGLDPVELTSALWLASLDGRRLDVVKAGPWTLVGRVHDRRRPLYGHISEHDPDAYERKLLARFWGGYVAVRCEPSGRPIAVMRDPSGALDCALWEDAGLTILASDFPNWLVAARRPAWGIDYRRVHQALLDPMLAMDALLLDGPIAVAPGTLLTLPPTQPVALWRPDEIARGGTRHALSDTDAAQRLADAIDEAVAGLASRGPLAAEVSGGLDSAMVASSLSEQEADVRLWLNAYGPDHSADERAYVDRLARRLEIEPLCVPRSSGVVTSAFLEAMPQRLRPGLAALDGLHDADWAARLGEAGLNAIMTGKGGDGLFVQPATGAVFSDIWRDDGWRALFSPSLPAMARWTDRSVWSLIGEARSRKQTRAGPSPSPLVTPWTEEPMPRPSWLVGIDDLPPGKQNQILATLYGVSLHGASLQTAVADVLHPLLSQPVVEACLALPIRQLTLGRRDRALARMAFADRLPPEILQRRSKGEMSAFYGRMIAGGLETLRPWLLEGRLAANGLIDRAAAEILLTPGSLIWRGGYADIMTVAAFEGWVRAWERRLGPSA